jgi:flagellar basal-body rod protein FlgC
MDFLKSIAIAANGMRAQAGRMRIISENIANSESTASSPGADPYRRRIVTFHDEINRELDVHLVKLGQVQTDTSALRSRHEPDNPLADSKGEVPTSIHWSRSPIFATRDVPMKPTST